MMTRTITLELLRHGPANNQLLSPLTPYLALCGNHDAETVHVGFEHLQFVRRLRELRYVDGRRAARSALQDAATEVSRIIASIRSLTAELSSAPRGDRRLVHLRLVLSASELALLPYELVVAPAGFPGQGQPLSLQAVMPITLTREVRRVSAATVRWPEAPRLLVIAASPRGVAPVPLRAHLLAIRRALDPWLVGNDADELARHVTVLPRATLAQVREACAAAKYTHVHILAHGYESDAYDDGEARYGLALHADGVEDRVDVVSGSRLAAALRCHPEGGAEAELPGPVVVTVASCDSGNVGSVIAQGASIAHELHEAGVPLVLASQFPLSVRGSVIMAELVYRRLLRGDDPRLLVHDLRQELHVASPDTHDWASIVAYAALPTDIDAQVTRARFQRARRAVDTVMARLDSSGAATRDANMRALDAVMARFEAALPGDDTPADKARAYGLLASAKKNQASLHHAGAPLPLLCTGKPAVEVAAPARPPAREARGLPDDTQPSGVTPGDVAGALAATKAAATEAAAGEAAAQRAGRKALDEARGYYQKTFRLTANQSWAIVQWLALTAALEPLEEGSAARDDFANRWTAALVIAEGGLQSAKLQEVIWAKASVIELRVLAQLLPEGYAERAHLGGAGELVDDLLDLIATDPYPHCKFDAYSLLRQLLRYSEWWWLRRPALRELPRRLAEQMQARGVQARWDST